MKNRLEKQLLEIFSEFKDVQGLGNDLVFIPEFEKRCTDRFIDRVYTSGEQSYCRRFADPIIRFASTWAAKEAVYKAVKQVYPDLALGWNGIEIIRKQPAGKPCVRVKSLEASCSIKLSLSHDEDYVWAIALCFES